MEGQVAVAIGTSQRGLAQGIMSEASRNGSLNRRDIVKEAEEVEEGVDKYSQKEMASEITDSWWNLGKVDDKAWQLVVPVALFVRMLPLPHHEAIFSSLAPSTLSTPSAGNS